ncbi:hypothetical protein HanXRQr2_Chr13g0579631 [Helianthus annuus]|uniref:Putative DUF3741-associated sequence motif protein n=1 Tax=Helianthus annuus TaxID=4232 RepID=A0A251SPI0_HELAN|nr:uncharacterized protein LOC110897865 [Helianthus annuus]KAF5772645.1 hypothetical protein HanXRQr2_Chr13g0579631 [Helianthus annuus]KAJ0476261.1 hypothetical protein HanHA300_Chr13g0475351 [Helianthus annuus]KAJ0497068.1 hypothetical protein HanHA89_Chr13g0507271 [Helianthus annuus]
MGAHKHGSKSSGGSGYVGGFLHLFDWNAKSRKKLFSSKTESPEQPKQTKRTDGNMPMTRFNMMDEDDMIGGMSMKGSSDYSCATSVTDEDGYGTKAPGVVARLMGLDSLPTVNFSDTYSNPSFDSQSLRDLSTSYVRKEPEFEPVDCQMEPVSVSRPVKVKPQKMVIGRAIEKFQTETLPPKSAKSIPITRNKLLSPIKSSGYVSSSNPARIMEAASKIPLVGSSSPSPSSSIQFRVKVSKKPKLPEPPRRPLESTNVKNVKSQQSSEPKKSISLALQAKANVQKREGLNHRSQSVRTQSNTERNPPKNPVSSNVLKQNNQKQNGLVDRGKSTTKSSCSTTGSLARKPVSQKTSHKKEPYSTRRKRSMEESEHTNNHPEKNSVGDRQYRSNRSGSDVVSFTFTAPIARPVVSNNGSPSTNRIKNTPDLTDNVSNLSSLTYNVIGSDALSTLLEQKLRELTDNSESVSQDLFVAMETDVRDDSSYGFSSYKPDQDQDRNDSSYAFSTNDPLELMKKHHNLNSGGDLINKDESSFGFSSSDPQEPMFRDYEYRKYLFGKQPSPNSVLEPSFTTESCNSSYTADSCRQNSTSVQAQELIAASLTTRPTPMDVDTELLDSASSITTVTKWEPDYVKEVLANIETMFVDFTIGKTRKPVNPRVFDRLEVGKPVEEVAKLRRELMFNCVSECMETRCRVWAKGLAVVRRPDWLAQEVYREITGWEDMKDRMVDELVDMDMSGHSYKKWLDFDVEELEIGVEIESRLLDSLINEIVDDILVL